MELSRRVVDVEGDVHFLDSGGEGPPAVLVHGLGGAAINWTPAAELLSRRYRVLALDLVGFGETPLAGRSVDVFAQRRLVDRFIREVAGSPALLMGNSMGGLISILQAAEAPETVSELVLVNPAARFDLLRIPDPGMVSLGLMLVPGVGDTFVRRFMRGGTPEAHVREFLAFVCHRPDELDQELVKEHIELARARRKMDWAVPAFSRALRSMVCTLQSRHWTRAVDAVRAPTLLLHGSEDRLVAQADVRKLAARRRDWRFKVFDAVGHVPQLECPRAFVRSIQAWSEEVGRASPGGDALKEGA